MSSKTHGFSETFINSHSKKQLFVVSFVCHSGGVHPHSPHLYTNKQIQTPTVAVYGFSLSFKIPKIPKWCEIKTSTSDAPGQVRLINDVNKLVR